VTYQPGIDPPARPTYPPIAPQETPESAPPSAAGAAPLKATTDRPPAGLTSQGRVRTTRVSAVWVGVIVAALVLIALLIFIAQNSKTVAIHYFGFSGHISLAVALLLAAVAGVLLVAIPGTGRILQLRHALKKNAAAAHTKR
jgi:uncharacterized integral membrane protein